MNEIQKAINQLGEITVGRYLPKGAKLHDCDMHGKYLAHYTDSSALCPMCIKHDPRAEGTTATEVELYIDLRDMLAPATNPHS
jgi:hypothetical protein